MVSRRQPKNISGDTSGYRGWRALQQKIGSNADGTEQTIPVWRNVITGEFHRDHIQGWNGEPPGPTGDISNLIHSSDAYKANFDRINWCLVGGATPVKPAVRPEIQAKRNYEDNYDRIFRQEREE